MRAEGGAASSSGTVGLSSGKLFTGRVIGSIATFSIISAVCLIWLYTQVIYPMATMPIQFTDVGLVSLFFDLLITVLILLAMVHNSLDLMTTAALRIRKPRMEKGVLKVRRFTFAETLQHLTLIATTATSALTGFTLMFYPSWGRAVANDLGGFTQTVNIHYASAIVMGILVAYHFGFYASKYVANKLLKQEARFDINFNLEDIKDFFTSMKYYFGRGERPKFAKYSYAQKFDYWGIYWGMIILGLPGLMIWAGGISAYGGLAYVFHVKEALLAVLFLGVFHFYQVHFTPRQFPGDLTLFTGVVSEEEMEEDHPLMARSP
jgi:cytochrome b subunit of formate dehydrogenase